MRMLSAKTHIALGQTGLLTALILLAIWLGLVPDRLAAVRQGRMAVAEAVAANGSHLVTHSDLERLEATLSVVAERNPAMLSAAVRRSDGFEIVTIGDHDRYWDTSSTERSSDTNIAVPLWSGSYRWGQVELTFEPLVAPGLLGLLANPRTKLVAFLSISAFVVFFFYLRRLLRHLDPSEAVPPHVRSALDTLAEGLLVVDGKGHIVLSNQAFSTMLGEKPDELLGRHASQLAWLDDNDALLEHEALPWARALAEGEPQRNDLVRLEDANSTTRSFLVNCSPVLGTGGKFGGVLISLDDVTQLEEHKAELSTAKEDAEAANRAKSDFLANMSHEIRTPMNAILGFTEVLKRGFARGEAERSKHLDTIHSSGKHLLELINDVLDLSKVESGRVELETIQFAPHALIADVVKVLQVKAREKGIALEFVAEEPIPETVRADPTRYRQIVTNLVSNAIKFTDQGSVRLVARLSRSEGQAPLFALDVVDQGIGIPDDKHEAIFQAFVQADSSVTRQFGGTGLGLPISRRFARMMGGDVSVRSVPGEGSVFTVTIAPGPLDGVPLLAPEDLTAVTQGTGDERTTSWLFPPTKVLVVDDGAENRELIRLVLEEAGIGVEEAENGQVCVEKVRAAGFDAILLDMQMPVMDGYTAASVMREEGVTTAVIALSADAMKGARERCLAAGCSDFLSKPVDFDLLLGTLAELMGAEASSVPVARDAGIERQAGDAAASAEPVVSRLLRQNPRYRPTVEKFVRKLSEELDAMDASWARGDLADLARLAHWLKGGAGTMGFDVFTEPAAELQRLSRAGERAGIEELLRELRGLAERVVLDDVEGVSAAAPTVARTAGAERAAPETAGGGPVVSRLLRQNPRYRPTVEKFVRKLSEELDAMDASWARGDLADLARLAHWLKGGAGTMGFDVFTEPAAELQRLSRAGERAGIEELLRELRGLAGRVVLDEDQLPSVEPAAPRETRADEAKPDGGGPLVSSFESRGPRFRSTIEKFVRKLHEKLDEMEEAAGAGSFVELEDLARWLQGAGGTIGFDAFTDPAANLVALAGAGKQRDVEEAVEQLRDLADRIVVGGEGEEA